MTLEETIAKLDELDDSLTICAARSPRWIPHSKVELCPAVKGSSGCRFPYFLEVSVAKKVLRAWSFARRGRQPNLADKCKAIIYYAENDAHILPEQDKKQLRHDMHDVALGEIRSMLSRLGPQEQGIFACACAEHMAPVFRRLASRSSVPTYDAILQAAWRAASGDARHADGLLASVAPLPEAAVDDSHKPEYYATLALGVLEHAIGAITGPKYEDSADLASCQAIDVYSSFDGIAAGSPTTIVNPRSPAPPGALTLAEMRSQKDALGFLLREVGTVIGERVHGIARGAARIIEPVVAKFAKGGREAFATR